MFAVLRFSFRFTVVAALEDYFLMADEESTILLQSYDASTPKFSIQYSAVEESSSIKSSSKQLRRIRKVGFDTTYHRDYFAFISSEICCVYDVNDPDRPVNCVTIRNCSCSDAHRNDPNRFRSFAFSGNGTMLLLTDRELFKWDYCKNQSEDPELVRLYSITKRVTLNDVAWSSSGNLIGSSRSSH